MSSHETIGWAMGAVLLLGACGETASGDPDATSSAPIPAATLPPGSKPDFILVAVDGLRLDDAWGDPEVAPFLSAWMQTALAPVTMIGSASGLNSALTSLLTGLDPRQHGIASLRDPFGQKLPPQAQTLAEDLGQQGWQAFASVAEPQLRGELSGLDQGFLGWITPTLDPHVFLEASNIAALGSNQLRALPDPTKPVFLVLQFSDLAQEGTPDPAAAIQRLRHHLEPHLGRLPHVQDALDLGQSDPRAALDEITTLLGRARGSQPYLAWRRGLREARLGAIDQALGSVLQKLQDLGRGREALLCVTSLRGAPLAPPQGRVRPAFLPDQMRVVARIGGVSTGDGKSGATLPGVFDLAGLSRYCRALLMGGGPQEPIAAVLVQDPGLQRFAAFGQRFHMEEQRLTSQVLWSQDSALQNLEANAGPVAVLGSVLVQRPSFGWRLQASTVPLDLRWRVMEGTLRPAQVTGEGSTASAGGVNGHAHLEPTGQVDMIGGARSQNWVLHVSGELPLSKGPWSGGIPALPVTTDPTPWVGDAPHPTLTQASGWARLELPPGGDYEVWMVRHPARMREPFPLEWAAGVEIDVTQISPEAIYAKGSGAAVIQLALPPKRECALAIRIDGRWLAPWETESAGQQLGSPSAVRLLLPPHWSAGAESDGGVQLTSLAPQPVFGPLASAPPETHAFIHALPPAE